MPKEKSKKEKKKTSAPQVVLQGVKGMPDILPKDEKWWKMLSRASENIAELHDLHFIETPILERAELFEAGVGQATDIVEKQMFTFRTKGDDRVTLRPEGTAPVMRSYLEHHLGYFASPFKAYYFGPMFRYERPQAGREREFHQWGIEMIGDNDPIYDGEVILAALDFLRTLKVKDVVLKINTIGCRTCRANYRDRLKRYYESKKEKLCKDCVRRFEKNPLRLLDCEEKDCVELKSDAPLVLDYLCQNCNNHFKSVLELVEDNGILYELSPHLVRGLDYYNRTVFEFWIPSYGSAIGGGGRYDYLAEMLSGRAIPAVGVALGAERIIEVMRAQEIIPQTSGKKKQKLFFIAVGDQAKKSSLKYMNELRMSGVIVAEALGKKSLKAQLKAADRMKAPIALIFGQKEVFEHTVIVRDMVSGAQETILLANMTEEVKKRM